MEKHTINTVKSRTVTAMADIPVTVTVTATATLQMIRGDKIED